MSITDLRTLSLALLAAAALTGCKTEDDGGDTDTDTDAAETDTDAA